MENNQTTPTPGKNVSSDSRYISIQQFLTNATTALTNAQLPDIEPLLLNRGITKTDVIAKLADVEALEKLNEAQKKEYGESYQSTADYDALEHTLHQEYMDHLTLARLVFKTNISAQTGLGIKGKRKSDDAGYCKQALQFYNGILNSNDYKAAMLTKGVTTTELTTMQTGYTNLGTLSTAKDKEFGEAQAATNKRNTFYDELEDWYSDFKETAIVALRKYPQYREQLGWLER